MMHAGAQKAVAGEIPPGWSYNPSAWHERRWLLCLAAIGLLAALYTGLSQLGVVNLWDPIFGAASSYAARARWTAGSGGLRLRPDFRLDWRR